MTAEVIELNSRREDPHLIGRAICLDCRHDWQAVCPIGCVSLECPECKTMKGVFNQPVVPEQHWRCACGCVHFFVGTDRFLCALCGTGQDFGRER